MVVKGKVTINYKKSNSSGKRLENKKNSNNNNNNNIWFNATEIANIALGFLQLLIQEHYYVQKNSNNKRKGEIITDRSISGENGLSNSMEICNKEKSNVHFSTPDRLF